MYRVAGNFIGSSASWLWSQYMVCSAAGSRAGSVDRLLCSQFNVSRSSGSLAGSAASRLLPQCNRWSLAGSKSGRAASWLCSHASVCSATGSWLGSVAKRLRLQLRLCSVEGKLGRTIKPRRERSRTAVSSPSSIQVQTRCWASSVPITGTVPSFLVSEVSVSFARNVLRLLFLPTSYFVVILFCGNPRQGNVLDP